MPQWFVSFEPSTRARTFMDSVKKKNKLYQDASLTAKDKLVDLIAHRWQLATVITWA